MTNFLDSLEKIKNNLIYVDKPITVCHICKSGKLDQCRANMRGSGSPDKYGLYCSTCRVLYLMK